MGNLNTLDLDDKNEIDERVRSGNLLSCPKCYAVQRPRTGFCFLCGNKMEEE